MRVLGQAPLRIGDTDHAEQLHGAPARGARRHPQVDLEPFGELTPDRQDGVERGHRLLEHHADLAAPHAAHLFLGELQEVAALEVHAAAHDPARRAGNQAHDAERAHALAAPRLADERDGLAFLDVPRHVVDRPHHAAPCHEVRLEILDGEERAHVGGV